MIQCASFLFFYTLHFFTGQRYKKTVVTSIVDEEIVILLLAASNDTE